MAGILAKASEGRSRRVLPSEPMAVLIASDLHKDMAGQQLLRGVSFKLERRERMTIAGRNGAGKTTLLRMLSGETSIDGGKLSISKGVRIALHD
jgi:ATP-binding cassette, subfamily F, member 3